MSFNLAFTIRASGKCLSLVNLTKAQLSEIISKIDIIDVQCCIGRILFLLLRLPRFSQTMCRINMGYIKQRIYRQKHRYSSIHQTNVGKFQTREWHLWRSMKLCHVAAVSLQLRRANYAPRRLPAASQLQELQELFPHRLVPTGF
jgi:hypothetical protein